jgi:cytochrome c peroxidase
MLGSLLISAEEVSPDPAPLEPLTEPFIPPDNPMSDEKVELGKMLFFDARLSGDSSTSCASCHNPKTGWGDGDELSRGYPGALHWRNSETIINAAFLQKLFWGGEAKSLEVQAKSAATGNLAGNGDPMMVEERLAQCPEYVDRFKSVFGTEYPLFTDVLKAIAAYERTLFQNDTPYDRFLKGDETALNEKARRGLDLFQGKAGCIQCHNGPLLTDQDFHNLGVPENEAFEYDPLRQIALRYQHYSRGVPEKEYLSAHTDFGLYYTTKQEEDKGKFRTHSLRYLLYTPPYMHNGVFYTLEDVVDFYNEGGGTSNSKSPLLKPLGLTEQEKEDLVELLLSMSGEEIIHEPPLLPEYAVLTPNGSGAIDE